MVNKLLRNRKLYRECMAEDATCSSDIDILSPKKIWRTCSSTSMVWVCIDLFYSPIAFYLSHFWTKTAFWMFLPIHSFGMVLSLDLFDWIVIDTYLCKIVGTQVARHQMFSMLWLKSTNMTLSLNCFPGLFIVVTNCHKCHNISYHTWPNRMWPGNSRHLSIISWNFKVLVICELFRLQLIPVILMHNVM